MGRVSLSGSNAPFDTQKVIDELMKVEERPIQRFKGRIKQTKSTKEIFQSLNSKSSSIQSSIKDLTSPSNFNQIKSTSSNDEILGTSVSSSEDAQTGTFDVFVEQLARSSSLKSGQFINNQNLVDNSNFGSDNNSATAVSDYEQVEGGGSLNPNDSTLEDLSSEVQTSGGGMGSGGDGVDDIKIDFNNDGNFTGFDIDNYGSIGDLMNDINNHSANKDGSGNQLLDFSYDSQTDRFKMVPQQPDGEFQIKDESSVISDNSKGFFQQIGIAENDSIHTFNNTQSEYQTDADTTDDEPRNLLSIDPSKRFTKNNFSSSFDQSSGTIEINNTEIDFDSDTSSDKVSTINELVEKVNSKVDGVKALFNEATDKIKLESENTGAGSIEVRDLSGNLAETLNIKTNSSVDPKQSPAAVEDGQDAKFKIDGDIVSSSDNSLGFNGLSLEAKQLHKDDGSNESIEISVNEDDQKIADSAKSFVDSFNSFIGFINKNSKIEAPEEVDGEGNPFESGPFVGDVTVQTIKNGLNRVITSRYNEANSNGSDIQSIQDVGIELKNTLNTSDANRGKLNFDSSKFKEALNKHPQQVKELFTAQKNNSDRGGEENGIAIQVKNFLSDVTERNGIIESRLSGFDDKVERLQERIDDTEERVEAKRESLERRFRRMSQTLGDLQQQKSFLSSRL